MSTPETQTRARIDRLLHAADWKVQDRAEINLAAALGVAVREVPMSLGTCDYLLFIDGKAAGTIEAKKEGVTLSGVSEQSAKYLAPPAHTPCWASPLPCHFESTGHETWFRDRRDPDARSRPLFAFPTPKALRRSLQQRKLLRARLRAMPPLAADGAHARPLRACQIHAIQNLEASLAKNDPRALIQLATGAGKTFTACCFSYRLLRHAKARRILFLVDRNNLGDQTLREYQSFPLPHSGRLFSSTYNVQHLRSNHIDPDAKVVISTIQRLYALLCGDTLSTEDEETSAFERRPQDEDAPPPLEYNPAVPIDTFDFIVTDECHRSIYGKWRQVLEYFDAFIIGLTATPSSHTLGFFNQNLVAEYPYERSVADGVNVGHEIYRIRTRVTEEGGTIDAGFALPMRDRRTRQIRYEQIQDDWEYAPGDLDRSVVNPNQIRTILQTYKERVFEDLFPERSGEWLPKTLVFAKDDNHAEEIVAHAREIFAAGDEFAKKITYRVTGDDPKSLINAFRTEPQPRIAVTVDMVATGTDIRPVEVLIFMRDVKSEIYYEQMKGRGVRTLPATDLKAVTPDAAAKTRFILIDAVGVSESHKSAGQPLERKRSVSFAKLLEQIAMGRRDEDALSSLADRLAALNHKLDNAERDRISQAAGGKSLPDLANGLLDAIDPDKREEAEALAAARQEKPLASKQKEKISRALVDDACRPFDKPPLRKLLVALKQKTDIIIDETTPDAVTGAGFDKTQAARTVADFKTFIEDNRDQLTALQILYNRPYGRRHLTYEAIRQLIDTLTERRPRLTIANLWQAYQRLDAAKVRGAPTENQLTEIVSLVRFALGHIDVLEPFAKIVEQRFNLWIGREKKAGREYDEEKTAWLRAIAEAVAANIEIAPDDFQEIPSLSERGGIVRARRVLGKGFEKTLLPDLQKALVA